MARRGSLWPPNRSKSTVVRAAVFLQALQRQLQAPPRGSNFHFGLWQAHVPAAGFSLQKPFLMRICAILTGEAARISAKDVLPFSFVRPGTGSRPRFLVGLTCWRLVYSTSSPPFASTSPAGPAEPEAGSPSRLSSVSSDNRTARRSCVATPRACVVYSMDALASLAQHRKTLKVQLKEATKNQD